MKDFSWKSHAPGGKGSHASASTTKSYHNGGVEGSSFADWYDRHLADKFTDPNDEGSDGSGSGGTKGSGSGGTKGSGSGGTKGSGSGGTKGAGSDETHGGECSTGDDTGTDKTTLTYTLGTDPQVTVSVTETPSGTLFFDIKPVGFDAAPVDINGLFFNLTDDSDLGSLNVSPDPNTGSSWSPVTGTQVDANSVDTLSDGSSVPGQFDVAVQFGTQSDSTGGLVQSANFTLWSDDGPLTFGDVDLDGLTILADSEARHGEALTVTDGPSGDDDDCDDPHGSDGTKGSGSGGTKGSGSGGTEGSGSGGTKGSGSGGTEGSGSGGTKGSGSGGTEGSGSGGTKGSGSDYRAEDPGGSLPVFADFSDDASEQDEDDDVVYDRGAVCTRGSEVSGGSGPGLADIMALMTEYPQDDDPSLQEQTDPWEDDDPETLI